ncbi:MAG: peptidoglycan-binding protein [Candidatus Limiplasma sp.]|nr:peptidoglycan-binding protein [Candidatus Limiplasma sp.]
MDLLKTILIYMSMIFVSSVQTAPDASTLPLETAALPPAATAVVQQAATPSPAPTPSPTPVPTPDITPNNEYKTIRVGDKGDAVRTLQRRLAELGYYTGDVDGVYGNQTRRAVERFQYYHGLSADGIAGKRTLTVLYESKDIVFAPVDVTPTPPPGTTARPGTPETTGSPTAARTAVPGATTPAPTYVPTGTPAGGATEAPTFVPTATASASGTAPADSPALPFAPEATDSQEPTQTPPPPEGSEGAADSSAAPETDGTAAPSPEAESTPGLEDQPPAAMEGYSFLLEGKAEPVMTLPVAGIDPVVLPPLGDAQGAVMAPVLRILQDAGIWVIPQENAGRSEYAFAVGEDVYQVSFDIDQQGNPIGLVILKNNTPQLMDRRVAVLEDGILYLYLGDVEKITGITFTLDEETKVYTVTMPGDS